MRYYFPVEETMMTVLSEMSLQVPHLGTDDHHSSNFILNNVERVEPLSILFENHRV